MSYNTLVLHYQQFVIYLVAKWIHLLIK